jgi:hypothetical protein
MSSNNLTTHSPLYIAESVLIRIFSFRLAISANGWRICEVPKAFGFSPKRQLVVRRSDNVLVQLLVLALLAKFLLGNREEFSSTCLLG